MIKKINQTYKINFVLGLFASFLITYGPILIPGLSHVSDSIWDIYLGYFQKSFTKSANSPWFLLSIFYIPTMPFFLLNFLSKNFGREVASRGFSFLFFSFLFFSLGAIIFYSILLLLVGLAFKFTSPAWP